MKKLLPGLLFGGILLFLLLRRVELSTLTAALSRVDLTLLIPALACKAVAIAAKAWRWAVAIEGGTGVRPRKRVLAASLIGFAANLVLPARLGEIARATVLRKHNDVPASLSLTSVGVTQLFDLLTLASLLVCLIVWGAENGVALVNRRILGLLFALLGAALGGLVVCMRYEDRLRGLLSRVSRAAPATLGRTLDQLFESFSKAIRVIKAPFYLAMILAYTLFVWLLELLAYGSALAAFRIAVTPAMAALVMVALNLMLTITVTPGNFGTHQLVSVLVLGLFAVPEVKALAFSIGLQAIVQTSIFVLGGILFYREGLSLDLIRRGSEASGKGADAARDRPSRP